MQELEITIMIDNEGNYIVDRTDNDPLAVWEEAVGANLPASLTTYQIKLKVPTPKPITVNGELPAADGNAVTMTIN